jgi:hypothetical protein
MEQSAEVRFGRSQLVLSDHAIRLGTGFRNAVAERRSGPPAPATLKLCDAVTKPESEYDGRAAPQIPSGWDSRHPPMIRRWRPDLERRLANGRLQ